MVEMASGELAMVVVVVAAVVVVVVVVEAGLVLAASALATSVDDPSALNTERFDAPPPLYPG